MTCQSWSHTQKNSGQPSERTSVGKRLSELVRAMKPEVSVVELPGLISGADTGAEGIPKQVANALAATHNYCCSTAVSWTTLVCFHD